MTSNFNPVPAIAPVAVRWTPHGRSSRDSLVDLALALLAIALNSTAYASPAPVLVAGIFYIIFSLPLLVPRLGGADERRIFTRVFLVNFVAAGIAAIYANFFGDALQLQSDAAGFFDLASRQTQTISLDDLSAINEGPLAIVIWRAVYDVFASIGFSRDRFVGISVNITAVSLTAVVALKITRQIFGDDSYRFRRLTLLISTCGLLWLFGAIHLRDAVVLFAITALTYTWTTFLLKPTLGWRLAQMVLASVFGTIFFTYLRTEFAFVPLAMAIAGVAALAFGRKTGRSQWVAHFLFIVGVIAIAVLASNYGDEFMDLLTRGREGYLEIGAGQTSVDSLGMALIIRQPLPVRVVLGSIYLILFPIPFWIGFQLESAYHLFKSSNVIFFYFVAPLLATAVWLLWQNKYERTPPLLFLLLVFLGFTFAVAASSLEGRHFGSFLISAFILACVPDLRIPRIRNQYRKLLKISLGGVVLVHAGWVAFKFL